LGVIIEDDHQGYPTDHFGSEHFELNKRVESRDNSENMYRMGVKYEYDPIMEDEEYSSTMTMKTVQPKRGELTSNKKEYVDSLEVSVATLKQELEDLKQEHFSENQSREREINKLKLKIEDLEEELGDRKREISKLKQLLEKDEEELGKWRKKFRNLENQYKELVDQFDIVAGNHNKEKDILEYEIQKLKQMCRTKEMKIESLNSKVSNFDSEQNRHLYQVLNELKEKNQGNQQNKEMIRNVLKKVDELFEKSILIKLC
jgi:chromosome segregation ATPase